MFFVGSCPDRLAPPKADLEAVLTLVFNQTELARFTDYYVKRGDVLYFRLGKSPFYTGHGMESLGFHQLVFRIKNSKPFVYDTAQDEKQKPVVYVKIIKLTADAAQVRIGFDVKGAVGAFTLVKRDTWTIIGGDVYQT